MPKKVTIYDIAKELGVTPATVSYALNNVSKVSEKMRIKILEKAKEMGYTRDYNAVSLSTGKTHMVALFLPFEDISSPFLQNPFYGEFIGFFSKYLIRAGYDLLVQPLYDEKTLLPWLRGRGVDAVAVVGIFPKHYKKAIDTLGIPAVLIDIFEYNEGFNNVQLADLEGEYEATSYLIENGHKNIAFIGGNIETSIIDRRRYEGYKKALEDHNIEINNNYIFVDDATFDYGLKVSETLMNNKEITAAVCDADTIAIGVIHGYRKANKTIPNDLSLIGFDDIQSASLIYPGLTTIRQNIKNKGKNAAKYLLNDLTNKGKEPETITLKAELVIRDSVSKI